MGIKKNIKKLINEPTEMSIHEIKNILEFFGYKLDRIKGSHYMFAKENCDTIILPVHNQKNDRTYLKKVKDIVQKIFSYEEL